MNSYVPRGQSPEIAVHLTLERAPHGDAMYSVSRQLPHRVQTEVTGSTNDGSALLVQASAGAHAPPSART